MRFVTGRFQGPTHLRRFASHSEKLHRKITERPGQLPVTMPCEEDRLVSGFLDSNVGKTVEGLDVQFVSHRSHR